MAVGTNANHWRSLKCPLLQVNIFIVSDFKVMFLQRVRFQSENFTTCQIFLQYFHNASDFTRVEKIEKTDFYGVFIFEKTGFYPFYSVKTTNFALAIL